MFNANSYIGKNVTYPKHNIDPKKKDEKWYKQYAEALYADYVNNKLTIPFSVRGEIDLLRLYAKGNQPVTKYMDRLSPRDRKTNKRKGYMNVSWDILSVVPKFKRVVMGMLDKMEYDIFIDALDEKSVSDKDSMKWRVWANKVLSEELGEDPAATEGMPQMPGMPNFVPNSVEELEMMKDLGSFKLAIEIAYEKALNWSYDMSSWDDIKRRIFSDLFDLGIAMARDYVDPISKQVKSRYVNPRDAIMSYSSDPAHKNMKSAGEIRKMTIAQLRERAPEIPDEVISQIADKYRNYENNGSANEVNPGESSDEYEDYDVCVIDVEFIDYDLEKYEKKKTSRGNYMYYPKSFDYKKKKTEKRQSHTVKKKKIRKVSWVVGTETVFNWGEQTDIPKNDSEEVCLSFKAYRENEKSILSSIVPLADNIQLTWLKMQNAIAMSAPSGIKVEVGALTGISMGGSKMGPLDILRLYRQTGDVVYKASTHQSQFTGNQPSPIDKISGGIGSELNEYITILNHDIEMIRQITGISPAMDASTLSTETPVGTSKMQVGATNNVMHNLFVGYKTIKTQLAQNMLVRWQVRIRSGEVKGLAKAIGNNSVNIMKQSSKTRLEELGLIIQMRPSDAEKNEIKQMAIQSSNSKKQGGIGIRMSDYMYISRLIDQGSIKLAQAYLAIKENQEQERQDQVQAQLEQQRQAGAAQLAQQKSEQDLGKIENTEAAKARKEIEVEKVKSSLRMQERADKAGLDDISKEKQHYHKLDEDLMKSSKTLGK
tara:strand:+ start:14789 stop:17089 length:2301 start_codon:yes stop_codon:yes gene_type:complete